MTIIEQLKEFAKVEFKNLPASYDFDSLTAIEQAELLRRKLDHVISECNTFVELTTKAFNELSWEMECKYREFTRHMEDATKSYMDMMDEKMKRQNLIIERLEKRIKELEGGTQ